MATTLPRAAAIALLAMPAWLAGCEKAVYVTDPAGRPVAGAQVMVMYENLSVGAPARTDAKGKAVVAPLNSPPAGLVVFKPGYPLAQEEFPTFWPARVRLREAADLLGRQPASRPTTSFWE